MLGVFARPPREGRVKTRLIPDLGARLATAVYRHCLAHSLRIAAESGLAYRLFLSEAGDDPLFAELPVHLQQGTDLGARMAQALSTLCHESGAGGLIIGSDCLDLDADYLRRAATALAQYDLVLATTLARAAAAGLRVCRLETVRDVDRLADVEHYPELRRLLTSR